jgi:opacity protein-like surface antigen
MKKLYMAAVFAVLPVLTSFGADFSLSSGGGVLFGGLFSRYSLTGSGNKLGSPVEVSVTQEMNQLNYGAYIFFDMTWAEVSVSLQRGAGNYREVTSLGSSNPNIPEHMSEKGDGMELMTGITLLGKYPFHLTRQFVVFPLAGIEYRIALLEHRDPEIGREYDRTDGIHETDSNGGAYQISTWNSLFIDIGAGVDFNFHPRLFMRAELLYVFRLQTPYETDGLEKLKKELNVEDPKLGGLTSGPVLRVGVGYTL